MTSQTVSPPQDRELSWARRPVLYLEVSNCARVRRIVCVSSFVLFWSVLFGSIGSHANPSWPRTHYVVQPSLSPAGSSSWNYSCKPTHLALAAPFSQASSTLEDTVAARSPQAVWYALLERAICFDLSAALACNMISSFPCRHFAVRG